MSSEIAILAWQPCEAPENLAKPPILMTSYADEKSGSAAVAGGAFAFLDAK
ncbi:hypothetical protein [Phyllobacterium endophyticum]|uniref:hypothetical protein n=1 Tax=Phyllobacterium endophyticum TaxID=1149773 RepID=UPI00164F37F4|nr:hypothetical protein [Phyllobacterium endophyticum]